MLGADVFNLSLRHPNAEGVSYFVRRIGRGAASGALRFSEASTISIM